MHPTPRLLTTAEAAAAAHVTTDVIRMWRTRGWQTTDGPRRLPVAGRDWRGWPLHRYEDVLTAERETRRSGKSHRRVQPVLQ